MHALRPSGLLPLAHDKVDWLPVASPSLKIPKTVFKIESAIIALFCCEKQQRIVLVQKNRGGRIFFDKLKGIVPRKGRSTRLYPRKKEFQ
jgi:hypothetical protein